MLSNTSKGRLSGMTAALDRIPLAELVDGTLHLEMAFRRVSIPATRALGRRVTAAMRGDGTSLQVTTIRESWISVRPSEISMLTWERATASPREETSREQVVRERIGAGWVDVVDDALADVRPRVSAITTPELTALWLLLSREDGPQTLEAALHLVRDVWPTVRGWDGESRLRIGEQVIVAGEELARLRALQDAVRWLDEAADRDDPEADPEAAAPEA
jgi:hypothetical protein